MAPCAPQTYVGDDYWSNVKRDASNTVVLQGNALAAACAAAFGGGCGTPRYRVVVVGDDGTALAMVARADTLAEGEHDWEWAVAALKSEFRRRAPTPQRLAEHFVSQWNKTHPKTVCEDPSSPPFMCTRCCCCVRCVICDVHDRWLHRSRSGGRRVGRGSRRSCAAS